MEYNRIRDLREDNDLSQKTIAKHLHVAQRTYSSYENGARNIPVQVVVKLAVYYKTSTDYLLNMTDEKIPYPKKKRKQY
jgi:transcriptional regulator with XRE-family HTH domain